MTHRSAIVLVVNLGSSSLKFAVFRRRHPVLRGAIDHFGPQAHVTLTTPHGTSDRTMHLATTAGALRAMERMLQHLGLTPTDVVHRIVHGGTTFSRPTRLRSGQLRQLRRLVPLAPLHLPLALQAITSTTKTWATAKQWGVFDTAAYRHLPIVSRQYALPFDVVEKYHIYKYGFHGISHTWALQHGATQLGTSSARLNAVTIHLGAGCSMTLWRHGRPVETSMGFTPLEGLAMSTRSGDIDPAIPLYLQQQAGMSARRVTRLLEQESGLFGLTGLRDMRDILGAAGHPVPGWRSRRWTEAERDHARIAVAIFTHDIQRYLSMYLGLLPHVRAIIWTGAIGQNPWIRSQVLTGLPAAAGTRVLVVPADEEQAIADAVAPMVD